ncbi:MAG: DUF4912 domain-containing protein [Syntrophomonadaceae bacterium]|nr:DUF4912 domain-containing protein [Syntrophomonadaceae bacterium]
MDLATLLMLGLALGVLGIAAIRRLPRDRNTADSLSSKARQLTESPLQGSSRLKETKFEMGGELILHGRPEIDTQPTAATGEAWAPVNSKLAEETIPVEHITGQQFQTAPAELPGGYNDNRIVAMVRDPYWLFAYWEINEEKRREIMAKYGPTAWEESQQVLRVYDVTDIFFDGSNAVAYFDIGVGQFSSSWHIPVSQPNRTFLVDRGLILKSGEYVLLARSNFITTPADQVSSIIDEEWMLISELDRRLYRRLGQLPFGSSPHFAFSQLVSTEAAKMAFGLSSPLVPRPQHHQESQLSETRSESHLGSGVVSKSSFMKILSQGLLPEGPETALIGIDPQNTVGIAWGGAGIQEKAVYSTEYTSTVHKSQIGEMSLTIEPTANLETIRLTLEDRESSAYETSEKMRKE